LTAALRSAQAAGWVPFVITNGATAQQERKLLLTGLNRLVAGWVVAEEAGVRKPDPRIFQLAAQRAGLSLAGAWMIGDSAVADYGRGQLRSRSHGPAGNRALKFLSTYLIDK
jgi:putative hydrolase of the HAD superfamily